jgi:hypothetical protein
MKTRLLRRALCGVLLLGSSVYLHAQPDAPSGSGASSEGPGKPSWKKQGKSGEPSTPGLPPQDAKRLAAARDKAQDDPTVRSLKEARDAIDQQLEKAMDAAILSADPGLAPTLEKVKQSRDRAKGMRDRFESLSPEQREQLKSARQAAKDDPAVVAAREKMKSADSPEARREAGQAMSEAVKAAVLKQNPALEPLLNQLGPKGELMRGPRGPMGPPPGMADTPE